MWVDIQTARETPDPKLAFEVVQEELDRAVNKSLPVPPPQGEARQLEPTRTFLRRYLEDVSARLSRPLAVFFDEADGLVGESMVSFLTQLRRGYLDREDTPFPSSVVLVGQRQVRDYVLREEDRRALTWLGTTSPFNVTAEATTLGAFTEDETRELLAQHTVATGQGFEAAATARIYALSRGHPWLVNALADQIVTWDLTDRKVTITVDHVNAAKDTIIVERRSHIDSLIARLREPRVRRILDPMLAGTRPVSDSLDDDIAYVVGLGLVTAQEGFLDIANPIYREVIPRALTYGQQISIYEKPEWFVLSDGRLDLAKLMRYWQTFWRKDGHLAADGFSYREAGPHLMLMAFLQRVVNGGGRIEREYAAGLGRLDLTIFWKEDRHLIEVKIRRDSETREEALDQIAGYLDRLGLEEGWLVLFDLRTPRSWSEKLTQDAVMHDGKRVWVIGC